MNSEGKEYEKVVYGKEDSPPVLLLHPLPGATNETLELGEQIASWGFRVHIPNLFVGSDIGFGKKEAMKGKCYLCESEDWMPDEYHPRQPAVRQIRDMARTISRESGQKLVVIGNCMTGIIPLELLADDSVKTAVLCQPATPIATPTDMVTRWMPFSKKQALGMSTPAVDASMKVMKQDKSKRLIGFHYEHDPVAPMERFNVIHRKMEVRGLASRFETYVLHRPRTAPEDWWTASRTTKASRKFLNPHSTLVNAGICCDRKWFRDKLRKTLSH